jgi:hypothetical protein
LSQPATTQSSRPFHQQLRASGQPPKLALTATMRKLLLVLNSAIKPIYPMLEIKAVTNATLPGAVSWGAFLEKV